MEVVFGSCTQFCRHACSQRSQNARARSVPVKAAVMFQYVKVSKVTFRSKTAANDSMAENPECTTTPFPTCNAQNNQKRKTRQHTSLGPNACAFVNNPLLPFPVFQP